GTRLTPSAAQLLSERKIRIKTIDASGRVFLKESGGDRAAGRRVHPLSSSDQRPGNTCALCRSQVAKKTELLTLLDNEHLVPKTHPRIALRGKLDTLIAQTLIAQTQFEMNHCPVLRKSLADLRSYMGDILRCEVTGDELPAISMGEMNDETLHTVSHQPLKYLGHDHIVPEAAHGRDIAHLNLLRAIAREAELEAARIYATDTFEVSRGDILEGLNRLSSALYVLMIMTVVAEARANDHRVRGGDHEPA
ncbi:MAG: ethanolamine utilization cob(I)yrinic acid a,c-diamide adenosyltransferase EutT, partial [Halioglobus sp.]|nr:ethanolamine utilization cob(I)yrinic acid a,c-diamide adenosyltransferase EutT [Halioglobus sp.]